MYYLKFADKKGNEDNVSCYGYSVQVRDGRSFVSAYIRDNKGTFERTAAKRTKKVQCNG